MTDATTELEALKMAKYIQMWWGSPNFNLEKYLTERLKSHSRLPWTERERAALDELIQITGLTEHAVLRQGLRVYQLIVKGRHELTSLDLDYIPPPQHFDVTHDLEDAPDGAEVSIRYRRVGMSWEQIGVEEAK